MNFDAHKNKVIRNDLEELLVGGFAPIVILLREFDYHKSGIVLEGLHFSAWSLLRHMIHRQEIFLNFIKNPIDSPDIWPEAYWPQDHTPENEAIWNSTIEKFEKDLGEIINVVKDPKSQLYDIQSNDKSLFWAAIANLQHNAYHIGQMKAVGRQLGVW